MLKLSIIVPVYNEERTVSEVLDALSHIKISQSSVEVIVVDDGSTDSTPQIIRSYNKKYPFSLKKIFHKKNMGKGTAVRTGIEHATGDYIIIQDADLEYNPQLIVGLFKPIQEGKATVVYGTRLKRMPNIFKEERTPRFFLHYLGNRTLSLITSVLYGQWITDMETCYKVFPKKALDGVKIHARGFEFEPEITAKLMKKGYKIVELPISTSPRGLDEGKKLSTFRDGKKALVSLITYRFKN